MSSTEESLCIAERPAVFECPICLTDNEGDVKKIIGCGHLFHSKCIDEWAITKPSCPLCRFVFGELPPEPSENPVPLVLPGMFLPMVHNLRWPHIYYSDYGPQELFLHDDDPLERYVDEFQRDLFSGRTGRELLFRGTSEEFIDAVMGLRLITPRSLISPIFGSRTNNDSRWRNFGSYLDTDQRRRF